MSEQPVGAAAVDDLRDVGGTSTTITPSGAQSADVPGGPLDAEHVDVELTETVRRLIRAVDALGAQVVRHHERAAAQEALIERMQSRIEELQADQVRALLGPVATELAVLHGELSAVAAREVQEQSVPRMVKELGILLGRVESGLELLGMEAVDATPGAPFDRRRHSAVRQVPTADPSADRTIAAVLRQGFGVAGAARATVVAQVTVFRHDPAALTHDAVDAPPEPAPPPPASPPPASPSAPEAPRSPSPPTPPGYQER